MASQLLKNLLRRVAVLYLDLDGVLHDENVRWSYKFGVYVATPGRTLFEWMRILEELLAPYPDVKIVLSTSWVRKRNFDYVKARLSPALQARVIGATYHSRYTDDYDFRHQTRVAQIASDVARRSPAAWFAVDDLGDDAGTWPEHLADKLVRTDGDLGLSDPAVQEAVRTKLAQISRAAAEVVARSMAEEVA